MTRVSIAYPVRRARERVRRARFAGNRPSHAVALSVAAFAMGCASAPTGSDGPAAEGEPAVATPAAAAPAAATPVAVTPAPGTTAATCEWRAEPGELAERVSPPDSLRFSIGDAHALLCYSRPSARGRTMIGGEAVPYGEIWRTGANEPTTLHLGFAAEIAGVAVEPGTYALYTVPGEDTWQIIVNRSTEQWGAERYYTGEIENMEAGRGTVPAGRTDAHVETMTFEAVNAGADAADLVLSWEGARVVIPVRRTG